MLKLSSRGNRTSCEVGVCRSNFVHSSGILYVNLRKTCHIGTKDGQ